MGGQEWGVCARPASGLCTLDLQLPCGIAVSFARLAFKLPIAPGSAALAGYEDRELVIECTQSRLVIQVRRPGTG